MAALLSVDGLRAGYGEVNVLDDVSFSLQSGEIMSIVGANGAGKTTLVSTIAGMTHRFAGEILFEGESIFHLPAHEIVRRGLVLVPEGGKLFPFMKVRENLDLGAFSAHARAHMRRSLDEVLDLFPILAERSEQLAGSLSGGERTMCAIARGVMSCPRLLMLDEPSLGLSPKMVETVFTLIRRLASVRQLSIILVEQNIGDALEMSSNGLVMERGGIVKRALAADLLKDSAVQNAYLGL